MKTKYEEIVNVNAIGKAENPISLNEILKKANDEQLTPSKQNKERTLFIGIDVQQDFMDNGALGVPGAHGDVERMTRVKAVFAIFSDGLDNQSSHSFSETKQAVDITEVSN